VHKSFNLECNHLEVNQTIPQSDAEWFDTVLKANTTKLSGLLFSCFLLGKRIVNIFLE